MFFAFLLELKGVKRFFANFIPMSNSEYVDDVHAEAFDLRTEASMDVDGADTSEPRSSNPVVPDNDWILSGPFDGPQATVDNELAEPSNCSLIQACALLSTRVGTLEEDIRELKRCAALQPSHSAHDDAMAHRMGTLEGAMRDLKASAASQHSDSAAALQPLLYAEVVPVAHRVGTLEKDMRDLKTNAASQCVPHRVGALEAEMRDLKNSAETKSSSSASASQQPQDDASSVLPQKRKSCPQYRVPMFKPMRPKDGKCKWCKRWWSKEEFPANYDFDKYTWEQGINKLFSGFEANEAGLAGGKYDFIETSGQLVYNVQQSLESFKTLTEEQGELFSNLMAEQLWQPDQGDDKCWFLFKGGAGQKRYITFGCVRCQRGVDLNYNSSTFWSDFMKFHPQWRFPQT